MDFQVTVYKQVPGADIESGWWAVVHPRERDHVLLSDQWLGPYRTKREANKAGKRAIHPHVGVGHCPVCHHYGRDCTGQRD